MIQTATQLQRALALASLGLHVIPCHPKDIALGPDKKIPAKSPRVSNGLYDATTDEETIKKWWDTWPDSLVGVVAGPSGLVFLDGDNKPGKDFDESLFEAGLTPPPTWTYSTISGGKHYVYAAPQGVTLNGVTNYRGMKGVDRRGGPSYAIWWGEVPAWPEWSPAPRWLCDPVAYSEGTATFSGEIEDWLSAHEGEPSPLLKHIQKEDLVEPGEGEYEHDVTLSLIIRIVSLAAQGESGGTDTLNILRDRYLDGYPDYAGEWDQMVTWAIKNCGGDIAEEPEMSFLEAQSLLPQSFPTSIITESNLSLDEIAYRLTEYLTPRQALIMLRRAPSAQSKTDEELLAIIEKSLSSPTLTGEITADKQSPKDVDELTLLTPQERAEAHRYWDQSFLGTYENWIRDSVSVYNAPYHRAAAWAILSTDLGDCVYFTRGKRKIPLNLWCWILGESVSGKSDARDAMQEVLHKGYTMASNPDLGDDSSIVGLYEKLRAREGDAAIFTSDEAEGIIREASQMGSWRSGQISKWTYLYDGRVPPMIRRGESAGEWTTCVFNMYLSCTARGLFDSINKSMFETGFLTRMLWFISEDIEVPKSHMGFIESGDLELDQETILNWRKRLTGIRNTMIMKGGNDKSVRITTDTADTGEYFRAKTADIQTGPLSHHRNWDIIRPSIIRLSISMYKMAALIALSDGRESISKPDLQIALLQGEELVRNLIIVANGVSDSDHSKQLDRLEAAILARPTGARSSDIYRLMSRKGYSKRDVDSQVEELRAQKRIRVEKGAEKGSIYIPLTPE